MSRSLDGTLSYYVTFICDAFTPSLLLILEIKSITELMYCLVGISLPLALLLAKIQQKHDAGARTTFLEPC